MSVYVSDHLDGQKSAELRQFLAHKLTTAPASPVAGQFYFDTTSGMFGVYNGSAWVYLEAALTTEQFQDAVGAMVSDTTSVDLAYDDALGVLTAAVIRKSAGLTAGTQGTIGVDAGGVYVDLGFTSNTAAPGTARLDQFAAPTAPVSMGGQTVTNVGTPSASTDAVTKAYVDALLEGLDPKGTAVAGSTADVSISTAPASLDGVTLASGDVVLLKNQTAPAQNGIYVFNGAGVPMTRADNANTWAELVGAYILVIGGTTNAGTGWNCTITAGGTLGTTAVTWSQWNSAATYSAGAGIDLAGTAFSTKPDNVTLENSGGNIQVKGLGIGTAQIADAAVTLAKMANLAADTIIGRANGAGTGVPTALSAAQVRTILGLPQPYATLVGNGSNTSFTVTHNLNTLDVSVTAYLNSGAYPDLLVGVERSSVNAVVVTFNTAPATNAVRIIVRA